MPFNKKSLTHWKYVTAQMKIQQKFQLTGEDLRSESKCSQHYRQDFSQGWFAFPTSVKDDAIIQTLVSFFRAHLLWNKDITICIQQNHT